MCGIIGYVGAAREGEWKQTHSLLSELLVESIERGRDATGFAALTEPLESPTSGRLVTDKEPVESVDFVRHNPFWRSLTRMRCRSVVGHVRASTSGSPLEQCEQPPARGRRAVWVGSASSTMAGSQTSKAWLIVMAYGFAPTATRRSQRG